MQLWQYLVVINAIMILQSILIFRSPNIFEGVDISEEAYGSKENVKIANSDFLNGMNYKKASKRAIYELEQNRSRSR